VLAYLRRLRARFAARVPAASATVVKTLGTRCVACHRLDGDGGDTGPELTHIGARRDAEAIRRIVTDPNDEYGDSMMPVYGPRLDAGLIAAIGDYLAAKK
jgi:mono/diheme cytochrome c family protein